MKKLTLTICLLVSLLLAGCNSYVAFTGSTDGSITIEGSGLYAEQSERPMYTGGILLIDGQEWGTFIKIDHEVAPDSGLFVTALGGATFTREQQYEYVDGSREERPDHVHIDGLFGGGLTWFVNNGPTAIVTSYDNKRGVSVGIGWRY